MFITLLTHANEPAKASNTGRLVLNAATELGIECERVIWQRPEPDTDLLERVQKMPTGLVYPNDRAEPLDNQTRRHWIVIDGTWQQARKMYNHSPYLHNLPSFTIAAEGPSAYHLRRNQVPGGLCTAETFVQLACHQGQLEFARHLQRAFTQWIEPD